MLMGTVSRTRGLTSCVADRSRARYSGGVSIRTRPPVVVVGRWLARMTIVAGLAAVALHAEAAIADDAQSKDAIRWYDAYDRGVKSVGAQAWAEAERYLLQARQNGPEQGPNVLFVGEDYRAFIPDYYLGIVQLRTGRFAQAEATFASVRARRLIEPKNRLASALTQQEKEATAGRIAAEAAADAAGKPSTAVRPPMTQPAPTGTPNLPVSANPLPGGLGSQAQTPIGQQRPNLPTFPAGSGMQAGDTKNPPPTGPATNPGGARAQGQTPPAKNPPPQTPSTPPPADDGYGFGTPAASDPQFANGVRQFLGGDYAAAVSALERADESPAASPRVKIYLACAHAALVLTGRAEPQRMAMARQLFADGDPDRNLNDDDRALISPRVLDRLRRP